MQTLKYFFTALLICLSPIATRSSLADITCQNTAAYDYNILRSPAYVRYNTFLTQWNFLELGTTSAIGLDVLITVYSPNGRELISKNARIPAQSERDIDVNNLLEEACAENACPELVDLDGNLLVDTFGLIQLDFDDSDASSPLIGRLSNYRPEATSDSFSFAFARDLKNPAKGRSFAIANTIDPSGGSSIVQNWLEVTNLGKTQEFLYELFDIRGSRIFSRTFSLPSKASADLAAGHDLFDSAGNLVQGVYLAKISTLDGGEFLASISRYSEKNTEETNFNYAFNAAAQLGTSLEQSFFARNDKDSNFFVKNFLEIANTGDQTAVASFVISGAKGELTTASFSIPPRSQRHLDLSSILESFSETQGKVRLTSDTPGSLLAQSTIYYFDKSDSELQTAYLSEKNRGSGFLTSGGMNTFLGMQNKLVISSTSEKSELLSINSRGLTLSDNGIFQTLSSSAELTLASKQTDSIELQELNLLEKNSYGVLSIEAPGDIRFFAELLRTRKDSLGNLDFIMPIKVRATGILEHLLCSDL